MKLLKIIIAFLLRRIYRVKVEGLENYQKAGNRVLIVANHVSYLDPVLIAAALPDKLTFAVNTQVAQNWLLKAISSLVTLFPMDPTNPLSSKALIRYLKEDNRAVIFPEGRITVTGSLMKIYNGTGMVADKSDAEVLPIRIDGAQYSTFSRLRGRVRTRWFPKITITILPPRKLHAPEEVKGRGRRAYTGKMLSDIMTEMVFRTSNTNRTLFQAFIDARKINGGGHPVLEDINRRVLSYNKVMVGAIALGEQLAENTWEKETVGMLLPNMNSTVIAFLGLQLHGRVPALLNYTVGAHGMLSSCETANIKLVVSSRQFVKVGKLEEVIEKLETKVKILYLEDIAKNITLGKKLQAMLLSKFSGNTYRRYSAEAKPDDPAVVLFTSGSEGTPKGVVLSHKNLLSNRSQLAARVDFTSHDIILNALPMFHSFGLTAGTLLPLLSGMKTFLYPSPLHYRIVPELSYDLNATILFGTNTFLAGYAKYAHPYDFYSIRYVFSGAEKLQEDNRKNWAEKFGVRIFEGYGATETSPVLAANTPMENRPGTVGQFLPGIEARLEPVPGVDKGGQLFVKGPNIMLGYYLHDNPGVLVPPTSALGDGWYDTGDIVAFDDEGYISIQGRLKRFAKVGGEMVSLTLVEDLANKTWPEIPHAATSVPDPQKGEMVVLLTQQAAAERSALQGTAKSLSIGEINIPKKIITVEAIPLLGTGKTDYPAVQALAKQLVQAEPAAAAQASEG